MEGKAKGREREMRTSSTSSGQNIQISFSLKEKGAEIYRMSKYVVDMPKKSRLARHCVQSVAARGITQSKSMLGTVYRLINQQKVDVLDT